MGQTENQKERPFRPGVGGGSVNKGVVGWVQGEPFWEMRMAYVPGECTAEKLGELKWRVLDSGLAFPGELVAAHLQTGLHDHSSCLVAQSAPAAFPQKAEWQQEKL